MGTHHQPYFLEQAKEDLVHHSAAWVVKEPERSPIFVDCHAVEDPLPWPRLGSAGSGMEPRRGGHLVVRRGDSRPRLA